MHKKKSNKSHSRNFNKDNQHRVNRNHYIRSPQVRLIGANGDNLGVQDTTDALRIARESDLDLVEINPNAQPPVCKIIDYSKYLYDKKKKEKRNKATKAKEIKEFRFSPVIQEHDIHVRTSRAFKFLKKGHNVKLTIFRKGRQSKEQAQEVMDQLLTIFADYSTIEPEPKEEGRKLSITIKSDGKTKNEKDSKQKDKIDKSEGKQTEENTLQEERTTSPKDKIIQKIKEKEASKRSGT